MGALKSPDERPTEILAIISIYVAHFIFKALCKY